MLVPRARPRDAGDTAWVEYTAREDSREELSTPFTLQGTKELCSQVGLGWATSPGA